MSQMASFCPTMAQLQKPTAGARPPAFAPLKANMALKTSSVTALRQRSVCPAQARRVPAPVMAAAVATASPPAKAGAKPVSTQNTVIVTGASSGLGLNAAKVRLC